MTEERRPDELARVHYLPARTDTEVVDAEVVTDEEYAALQRAKAAARFTGYRADAVRVYRGVKTVAGHDRTKTAGRVLGREVYYLGRGAVVAVSRVWQAKTNAGLQRDMREARAAGDTALYLEIQARAEQAREHRHRRRMELLTKGPKALVTTLAVSVAVVAGLLLVLGLVLAVAQGDVDIVLAPIKGAIDAITWTYWLVVTWGFLLLTAAGVISIAALRWLGKHHSTLPAWAAPADTEPGRGRDVVPDEGAIVAALRALGYGPLNNAFKEGWSPRWVSATTRVGRGYHTQLLLPRAVPVEEIAKRKNVLAHNLLRKPVEVWPTEPKEQPGVLDLWVADQGILTEQVAPWPLLTEGECDYFKGVPVAVDARGDQIIGRLMAANYLIAGIMGSGKSSLVICLLLGAMLDPLVDIAVHVLAYNVDYDAMRPRLSSLVKGDEEEHIEAAMETLRGLVSEVSERGRILEELGGEEAKLTREIAARDPRMRPRVVVFDEVHELFTHKKHGEEAKELALKVTKKARKTGITLLWITPDADAASLPRGISKTASHRVAFAINDHQGNDAILGTGMHKRGYSATTLVAGEDVGTAMAAGFAKTPGLIRAFYVRKEKGVDEITPVVERALALGEDAGISATAAPAAVTRDLLADVAAALGGDDAPRATDVAARLRELAPRWQGYQSLTGERLAGQLEGLGVKRGAKDGYTVVRAARVRHALAEREVDDQ
ncbi:FtsK/SpoIIIE domain-containing protein [Amycolatopsis sp. GM8]|uniref:FtsK/SpoIIIE domain-containing protein n=1 Tax=Amycolatopsis sp. GM8 TaxID=2896530 RepID=UPI001F40DD9F|nr:FtsK/SpoIIIE domain-containing protein [Amycolatopsis sp. GM8]